MIQTEREFVNEVTSENARLEAEYSAATRRLATEVQNNRVVYIELQRRRKRVSEIEAELQFKLESQNAQVPCCNDGGGGASVIIHFAVLDNL